jgi:hypothetical protein
MAAKLALRLRDLDKGELLVGEFEDRAAALAWLRARPHDMEVIGVASSSEELAEADELELRAAMRPLDEAERAKAQALDESRIAALREHIAREQARYEEDVAAERDALADADPQRPMIIAYDEHAGLSIGDPSDTREIPEVAKKAVLAWVAERNEWVHGRRQHVARAVVTVWPGSVPSGDESERCHAGGQFETEPGLADA